ncbi:SulP family inorganic anion transporter [Agromyces sp. NPDC056523]|uniref:SulP family inorganic anion transporter n=1 Tax=Agromyces sp. NPDC056523 TaxID=3345850 RepID=UPI00366D5317
MTDTAARRAARGIRSLLPSTADYRDLRRTWKGDLVAGVTVGIVALPLALAFGVSSGAGAASGLVTAIVAGLVAAVFGGSNVQVSGPTGAMVVVLAPIIATHGTSALAVVGLLAGLMVLAAGVLRLGRAVTFIPWPVIEGFTLGIAVIIFLQQVPAAVGVPATEGANAVVGAIDAILRASWPDAAWSLAVVAAVAAIMLVAPRVHRLVPGSILGIIVVTAITALAGLPVATIGALPSGLPMPAIPVVAPDTLTSLLLPAATVAALAAIESLLSARVAASISDTGPYDADRELVGQGLASIASAAFGGMPATGAIARTAVNVRTGGRTRLAAIVHAVLLAGMVALGATVVGAIPLAALAGVLMVTAARMIPLATVRTVVGSTRADAAVFVGTAIITVSVDLITAVLVGVAVAAFLALRSVARSSGVHREELPAPAEPGDERVALFRLEGALFFGAAERMLERVAALRDVDVVIIRMSQLQLLDATGAQVITELIHALERRGVTVLVKGIQGRHLELARRVGVIDSLRDRRHLFDELPAAVEHARSHVRRAAVPGGSGAGTGIA